MFDDNQPLVDAIGWLDENDRAKVFELNARKAYTRLNPILDRRQQAATVRSGA